MTFGPCYQKIQTAFKRDERNVIIPGEWTLPEFTYLADNDWLWTEKVDGTNIRLHWDGEKVTIGGRTDNAQIPTSLIAALEPYTDKRKWTETFLGADDVTVYGEGYGAGIQKGGHYRSDKSLVVFDIRIGDWWLKDEDVVSLTAELGLDLVPQAGLRTLNDTWELIKSGELASYWKGAQIEGLVGRPAVDLFTRKGERIITKLKVKDWQDYQRAQEKK